MSAEFVFEDKKAREYLAKMLSRLRDIESGKSTFANLLAVKVYADIIDHFEEEQGPEGAWDAWSDVYKKHLAKIGRSGNKKLQMTGRLRNTVQPYRMRKVTGGIQWFNNAKTSKGFPYAEAHDEGGPVLPQRKFMWLSKTAMEKLSEQVILFMNEKRGK